LKERKAEMEGRTDEINGARSFEDRVFPRFDAIDNRFDALEVRVVNLEAKQYDTRPIWQEALKLIGETNRAMVDGFAELRTQIAACAPKDELQAGFAACATKNEMQAGFAACATKNEMQAGFADLRSQITAAATDLRAELDFGVRRIGRKLDVLNQNLLELQADHRYVDTRLEKVEQQLKPS
jgi:hypothetical protein